MIKSKYKTLAICFVLPFCLTGCGIIDAAVHAARVALFTSAVVIELLFSLTQGIGLANAAIRSKRGTNVVTRFARNGMFSMKLQNITTIGMIVTVLCGFLGFYGGGIFGVFICIPSLLVLIAAFVLLYKDTHDVQRVKDARVMTKASLDVTAQTAAIVGTTAGTLIGGPGAGTAIGQSIGNIAGAVAANASSNMQVEGAAHINASGIANEASKLVQLANPELFLQQAAKTGIPVQGRSIEQIAEDVVRFAPTSRLNDLDQSKSKAELAMDILNAYTPAPEQPSGTQNVATQQSMEPAPTVVTETPTSQSAPSCMPHATEGV